MAAFDRVVERHPHVDFDIYIDDLQTSTQGSGTQVLHRLLEAAGDLKFAVNHDIMADLAVAKAAVVASNRVLASKLRRSLGEDGGVEVACTPALGIDFSCGRKRAAAKGKTLGKRLATVAARRRRMADISKASKGSKQAHKLVQAGTAPAALYGACVTGLSDTQLYRLRVTASAGTAPRAQGRSLDVTLQLSGLDMPAKASGAPIVRWAQEVWSATGRRDKRALDVRVLREAWMSIAENTPIVWAQVADPIGAAMLSGRRLGWTMDSPFEWTTDEGIILKLGQDAPALVEWHVVQAAQRLVERRVALNCATEELRGRRANLGFIRRMLSSKAKDAMSSADKCALKVVAANGFWPRLRQAEAGYPVDPLCEKCDASVPDTVHHRAWCCQWHEAVTRRMELASPELVKEAKSQPDSALFARAIRPHPADVDKVVAQRQQLLFWRDGEPAAGRAEWRMSGNIFYDGSCFRNKEPELSTATFAVVEVDDDGTARAVLRATVSPEMPQTSQAAEHSGRLAAVQMLTGKAVLHGDCKAVVDTANMPTWKAAHHKKLHAGARRAAETTLRNHLATDVKVKAHRKLDSAENDRERWEIRANAAADTNAVAAQLLHPLLTAQQRAARQDEDKKLEQVCRVLGAVPRMWPRADRLLSVRPPGSKERRKRPAAKVPHDWQFRAGVWACAVCLKRVRTQQAMVRRRREECAGLAPKLAAVVASPQGHVLAAAADSCERPVLFCQKCGNWAESKPRALLKPCKNLVVPSSEGYQALRRLAAGLHPRHNAGHIVGPVWAIQLEHQDSANRALDRFLEVTGCKGRKAALAGSGPCGAGGRGPEGVSVTADVAAQRQRAPGVPPSGSERMAALKARVAARASS